MLTMFQLRAILESGANHPGPGRIFLMMAANGGATPIGRPPLMRGQPESTAPPTPSPRDVTRPAEEIAREIEEAALSLSDPPVRAGHLLPP